MYGQDSIQGMGMGRGGPECPAVILALGACCKGSLHRWVPEDGERNNFCLSRQFKAKNSLCRPPADVQCDLAEYCDGSSASCPPDLYVQDGHDCEHGTGYCYKGRCQSADLQCRRLYGTGSGAALLSLALLPSLRRQLWC